MRDLKFRCWDKRFNRWEDDFAVNDGIIFGCFPEGGFDFTVYENDYVVQQYIGMKDKNGKEIYEGDIIEDDLTRGLVKYDVNGFYVYLRNLGVLPLYGNKWEVTGNIFDNNHIGAELE